ncbi:hypothetical protein D3C73_1283420 [compost metagenome]
MWAGVGPCSQLPELRSSPVITVVIGCCEVACPVLGPESGGLVCGHQLVQHSLELGFGICCRAIYGANAGDPAVPQFEDALTVVAGGAPAVWVTIRESQEDHRDVGSGVEGVHRDGTL